MSADPAEDVSVDIAIVGGGATGVEFAAELYNAASSLRHYGLEVFDETRLRVTLIEAGPRILPALPEALAKAAHQELEALGVRVLANTAVSEAMETGLRCATGEEIHAIACVWAAGVQGPRILEDLDGLELARSRQPVVLPTLQTSRDERIFALGDCCFFKPEGAGSPVPPRAQAAHQMAPTAYRNILR
jgi:NADH:ubiquinone reductase (H+-translocating)